MSCWGLHYIDGGIGCKIDLNKPYLLVIFHPVTTKYIERKNIRKVLDVLAKINIQTIWLWPNIDAGADFISTEIRSYRETKNTDWLYLVKNFTPEVFQKVLKNSACAIGNSSSFMRDSTFSGVPVVLVGNRQVGREHGKNLIESDFDEINLKRNIMQQLDHGKYSGADIYGDGNAAKKIVNHLINLKPDLQKMISYIDE